MKPKVGDIVAVKGQPDEPLKVVSHIVGDRVACGSREAWGWLYAPRELTVVKDVAKFMTSKRRRRSK